MHEKIINEPYYLKFKKNGDVNTACFVANISNDVQPEELKYWIEFMDEENKKLVFLSI